MLFFSSYHNRIDKKGRISVPASFRGVLAKQEFGGLIAYASLKHPCIEACGLARFNKMNERIEQMDPFSNERDALANQLFGQSVQLAYDSEGRVGLPDTLLEAAGIKEDALFVGKGEVFEIWDPKAYARYAEDAKKLVKSQFHQLTKPKG